ncbi:hypothetical protein ACWGRK_15080 [Saccharomonospora azurea]|uniref:Excreted virulence factor EspC, type VII ESX diderm n=1 Tax=Saccharomonospora azurea NA-128 TaxID=882081 RepID=H8GC48_9PSEU|nr:hypothetical protein [Saccharomonospora azurea]EHY87725.1 hypothetical protein SacazDRAFT_00777 [Saccharomonospora azurea NA-128]
MADGFKVEPAELVGYAELMKRNAEHFLTIKEHAVSKGGDTSGFTGLLSLLVPVVTTVADLYGATLDFGHQMLTKDAAGLEKAAQAYEKRDQLNGENLGLIEQGINTVPGAPVLGGAR